MFLSISAALPVFGTTANKVLHPRCQWVHDSAGGLGYLIGNFIGFVLTYAYPIAFVAAVLLVVIHRHHRRRHEVVDFLVNLVLIIFVVLPFIRLLLHSHGTHC